jgi:hypothetical protein
MTLKFRRMGFELWIIIQLRHLWILKENYNYYYEPIYISTYLTSNNFNGICQL